VKTYLPVYGDAVIEAAKDLFSADLGSTQEVKFDAQALKNLALGQAAESLMGLCNTIGRDFPELAEKVKVAGRVIFTSPTTSEEQQGKAEAFFGASPGQFTCDQASAEKMKAMVDPQELSKLSYGGKSSELATDYYQLILKVVRHGPGLARFNGSYASIIIKRTTRMMNAFLRLFSKEGQKGTPAERWEALRRQGVNYLAEGLKNQDPTGLELKVYATPSTRDPGAPKPPPHAIVDPKTGEVEAPESD
jgi:hypothetical protein